MKFAKIAKDITGRVIEEGDILMYWDDGNMAHAVVVKILQRNRNEFPSVQLLSVATDWRGSNVNVQRSTIGVDIYKSSRIRAPSDLRDDVPYFQKVKEIQQEILTKTSKRK